MAKRKKRAYWATSSVEKIRRELKAGYSKTLRSKARRATYIFQEFGPSRDMLLVGGLPSMYALHEFWVAYIEGLYLSTISCAHIFVEHILGGHLIMANYDAAAEGGLRSIADKSFDLGSIDKQIHARLDELRTMRIAYSHAHVGLKPRSHMARILRKDRNPHKLLQQDAKLAIQIVSDLLRHLDPNFGPPSSKSASMTTPD